MPYEVEIETPDGSCILTVSEVEFKEDGRMFLRNCNPDAVPEAIKGIFRFHSHRQTAIIKDQKRIESIAVSTHLTEDELTNI